MKVNHHSENQPEGESNKKKICSLAKLLNAATVQFGVLTPLEPDNSVG
jgi:hypothetical protein